MSNSAIYQIPEGNFFHIINQIFLINYQGNEIRN